MDVLADSLRSINYSFILNFFALIGNSFLNQVLAAKVLRERVSVFHVNHLPAEHLAGDFVFI